MIAYGVATDIVVAFSLYVIRFGLPVAFFFTVAMLHPPLLNM
ncbi:hypothetical protein GCK32_021827, partial [Trichostrongylus colubriformis]